MLSDLSICRALIARKTPIILAEGGQTLLNPCIRCDVYSQSRHSSRQQGSMRGVFFCVQKRREYLQAKRWSLGRSVHQGAFCWREGKISICLWEKLCRCEAKAAGQADCPSAKHRLLSQPYKVRGYSSQLDCHVPRSYKRVDLFPIHPSCKCPHSTLLRRAADGQADYPDGRKTHLFSFEQGACR